jgi:hypothetical protein
MALTAGTLYEALDTFVVSDGSKLVTIKQGDLRLGAKQEAINSEVHWIAAGSTDAEKLAARRAANLEK